MQSEVKSVAVVVAEIGEPPFEVDGFVDFMAHKSVQVASCGGFIHVTQEQY